MKSTTCMYKYIISTYCFVLHRILCGIRLLVLNVIMQLDVRMIWNMILIPLLSNSISPCTSLFIYKPLWIKKYNPCHRSSTYTSMLQLNIDTFKKIRELVRCSEGLVWLLQHSNKLQLFFELLIYSNLLLMTLLS